jgi:N-acetylglutamate synthase-like GNAT family acetyltransferase
MESLIGVMAQLCDVQGRRGFYRRYPGAAALVSGGRMPTLNTVLVHDELVGVDTVAALIDRVADTGLPYNVQTRPMVSEAVRGWLSGRGFAVRTTVPFMVWHGTDAPEVPPSPLEVYRIDSGRMAEHVDIAAAGFGVPTDILGAVMTDDVLDLPAIRCYIGTMAGAPVTTGIGALVGEWVGVFNVATPAAHRRHGYGSAVTARILEDAVAVGAHNAYLQSTPGGLGVYQRLGFTTAEQWAVWM